MAWTFLRTSFLMCVSSYKASSRDHCCPRRSDMAAQSLRTKAAGYSLKIGCGGVRHRFWDTVSMMTCHCFYDDMSLLL